MHTTYAVDSCDLIQAAKTEQPQVLRNKAGSDKNWEDEKFLKRPLEVWLQRHQKQHTHLFKRPMHDKNKPVYSLVLQNY